MEGRSGGALERGDDKSALGVLAEKVRRAFPRRDGILFAGAFILALLIHMYMLTHKLVNHDDVSGMFTDQRSGLTSGRFLLNFIGGLSAGFSSPWLNGFLAAFFLALGVLFTVRLLKVKRLPAAFLIAAVMISFPVVASTYPYMFCAFQYMFALSFSALGAYCIAKERLPWMLGGSAAIALAMGCYQAYFPFAATLVLTAYLLDLCGGRWGNDWKRGALAAVKYVLALALGMVLYFVILKICLWAEGEVLSNYQGISSWADITPEKMLERIGLAYEKFFAFYRNDDNFFLDLMPAMSWICMGAGGVMVLGYVVRDRLYRQPLNLLLIAASAALFPLGSALSYVMTDEFVHHVMKYALVVTLLFPAVLADRLTLPAGAGGGGKTKAARAGTQVLAALLLAAELVTGYECFVVTNRAYFMMDISYETAFSYYDRLITKLEMQEGYTRDSEIAMIGSHLTDIWTPEVHMTGAHIGNTVLNIYSLRMYLVYFHAFWYNPPDGEALEKIKASEEFREMPVYPAEGSIRTIDDVIVVKLTPPYDGEDE